MVSVLQKERTLLWFHLHMRMLWENILLSSWTYKKWQVFRLESRTVPLICRLYNQILCVFHVARTKYKQQSEINFYIKGGQELPDFAALLQQKLWEFSFYFLFIFFWWGDEDEIWIGSMLDAGSRWSSAYLFLCTKMQVKGRQRKTSLGFLYVVRPAAKYKAIFYLPTFLKKCKAVREHLNAIFWNFLFCFALCHLWFVLAGSGRNLKITIRLEYFCASENFYLLLWYFEKYSQKIIPQRSWGL